MARLAGSLAAAALALAAAGCPSGTNADRDPAGAARGFLEAVHRRDCDRAFAWLSTATRAAVEAQAHEMIAESPHDVGVFSPRKLYCEPTAPNPFGRYVPDTVKLAASDGQRATLHVVLREGREFLVPGFFPTSHEDTWVTMTAVREGERWRVELPVASRPPSIRPEPLRIDGVLVETRGSGSRRRVRARFETDLAPAAIEAAALDFDRLGGWLPIERVTTSSKTVDGARRHDVGVCGGGETQPFTAMLHLQVHASPAEGGSHAFGIGGFGVDLRPAPCPERPELALDGPMLVAYRGAGERTHVQLGYTVDERTAAPLREVLTDPPRIAAFLRRFEAEARRLDSGRP